MSVQQPESNMQPSLESRPPSDDTMLSALGSIAIPKGTIPKPAETTEADPAFVELNPEQLSTQFITYAGEKGLDVANPPKTTQTRLAMNQAAFTLIHDYHQRKHDYEWKHEIEFAEAPPLAGSPMEKRIQDFYKNPKITDWATDDTHLNALHDLHEKSERYTKHYRFKIPEIDDVIQVQAGLIAQGYDKAGMMLSDLLAVYAEALKALIMASSKMRLEKEAALKEKARTFEE